MDEQEIYNLIKQGYDPIPSMYPKTLFARQNGKSMTDFKNFMDLHFWQLYIYSRMLRKMSETSVSTKTVDKVHSYLIKDDLVQPLRAKHQDGLRAKVTLVDEWAEYCRYDVEMTMKFYENIKNKKVNESMRNIPFIKNVIFNEPATIVFWSDNTKTVVKCHNEKFDPEKGLAMAIAKKALGNEHDYYAKNFEKWLPKSEVKVEPEKPKRMTFRDEARIKHPDRVDDGFIGGVRGCPKDRPLGGLCIDCDLRKASMGCMLSRAMKNEICRNCWDREIPEDKTFEDSVLRAGDKAVKITYDGYDCYNTGDICVIIDQGLSESYVLAKCISHTYSFPHQYMRKSALKKLSKDQTLKHGDKAVVVKKPSYGCGYNIGDIITISTVIEMTDRKMGARKIDICANRDSDKLFQRLSASDVVKIVE